MRLLAAEGERPADIAEAFGVSLRAAQAAITEH